MPSSDIEIIGESDMEKPTNQGKSLKERLGGNSTKAISNTARGTGRNIGRGGYGRGGGSNGLDSARNPNQMQIVVGRGKYGNNFNGQQPTGTGAEAASSMFDDRLARYQQFLGSSIRTKLSALKNQSMKNLSDLDQTEKKFSGRSHLYVGGVASSTTEKQLKEWFGEFGEVGDVFYKKEKMFAFVRMGTRLEAEKAKAGIDGQNKNGKVLRVKYSVHQAAIKVSNLGPWVSNELLHAAFSVFGEIERLLVYSDEKGKSKEEGIVEFVKKGVAMEAVRRCNDGCFFLCTSLRPVYAEMVTGAEDDDGVPEKSLHKYSNEYNLERETGPRFAVPDTFEYEYGTKWKGLYELKKQKEEALKVEMKLEEAKLVAQMEYSRFEHETDMLRDELRKKEAVRDQQKSMWSMKEKYMEDIMKQEQEKQRCLEEGIFNRIQNKTTRDQEQPQEEISTGQGQGLDNMAGEDDNKNAFMGNGQNSLFTQAQQLSSILDLQESLMGLGQNSNLQESLMGLGQNSNSLPDEGTLETLNALLNLQGSSNLSGNFGNKFNKRNSNVLDTFMDAEDLHHQGEMGKRAGKKFRA